MRALIVEDNERLRQIVRRTLTLNLACDEADSIEELLQLHPYDVLVLDRRLPDGDGVQLCRDARSRGFANLILMLTTSMTPAPRSKASASAPTITSASRSTSDVLGARHGAPAAQ